MKILKFAITELCCRLLAGLVPFIFVETAKNLDSNLVYVFGIILDLGASVEPQRHHSRETYLELPDSKE